VFNLDLEIRCWCRRVTPGFLFRAKYIAELEDHVHCAVAELIKRGASEEMAFRKVTAELGKTSVLRNEFRKNTFKLSNLMQRIGYQSTASLQYAAAAMCLIVALAYCVSVQSDAIAEWAKNAMVAWFNVYKPHG
jgi:hypothetical protein